MLAFFSSSSPCSAFPWPVQGETPIADAKIEINKRVLWSIVVCGGRLGTGMGYECDRSETRCGHCSFAFALVGL